MSNCNWPLAITRFLVTNLQEVCEVFTYLPNSDRTSPYAVLEIDEMAPLTPIDRAKISFKLHVNSCYAGNQEILSIAQKLADAITGKNFCVTDSDTNSNALVRFKCIGIERNAKISTYRFNGLINIKQEE